MWVFMTCCEWWCGSPRRIVGAGGIVGFSVGLHDVFWMVGYCGCLCESHCGWWGIVGVCASLIVGGGVVWASVWVMVAWCPPPVGYGPRICLSLP